MRGHDLLVRGHCPNCSKPLTSLLTPTPRTGARDNNEYLALLGALGVLVGMALATTDESTE